MAEATRRMIVRLEELLAAYKEGKPGKYANVVQHLSKIPADVACAITARVVIDGLARNLYYQQICYALGDALKLEYGLRSLKNKDLTEYLNFKARNIPNKKRKQRSKRHTQTRLDRSLKQNHIDDWSSRDAMRAGSFMLEVMLEVGGCIQSQMVANRALGKGKRHLIVPLPETVEWLKKAHEGIAANKPFWLPLNAPPKDWKGSKDGGYWTDELPRLDMIKGADEDTRQINSKENCPEVYAALNFVQRVPYLVNRKVYELAKDLWDGNLALPCLPQRQDDPIPEAPDVPKDSEEYRQYRKAVGQTYDRNREWGAHRILYSRTLLVAKEMALEPLWFVHQLDFRGRMYAVPSFLNPQGDDLARGLLMFRDGCTLDSSGIKWLRRHLANCWGNDKGTWQEREQWTLDNEEAILRAGQEPTASYWWTEADKAWQFIAACMEYAAWKQDPAHVCRLPIHIDGSNNGLQLFSLMLRDSIGAEATNCKPSDKPQDIYQRVADRVQKLLQESYDHPMSKAWLEFWNHKIPRSLVKRSVMVLPYGATIYTSLKYIGEAYTEHCMKQRAAPIAVDSYRYLCYINGMVWRAINEIVVGATQAMKWLHAVADLHSDAGKPICWVTPCGFYVKQEYHNSKHAWVKTSYGDRYLIFRIRDSDKTLSRKKQKSALSPNFVHSLDASVLVKTVNRLESNGVHQVACVHDSFGVLPSQVDVLSRSIREAAVEVFSTDVLREFSQCVQSSLPNPELIPEPPAKGEFDLQTLYQSEYFFA